MTTYQTIEREIELANDVWLILDIEVKIKTYSQRPDPRARLETFRDIVAWDIVSANINGHEIFVDMIWHNETLKGAIEEHLERHPLDDSIIV